MAASQPSTWKQTWFTISGTDGFTLPGMIEDPGWTGGSWISAMPARGPMLRSRRSEAILPTSTARRRSAPDTASTSPMLCVTRKRSAAGRSGEPGGVRQVRDGALGVVVAGVEPGAERRGAEVQLVELFRGPREIAERLP